MANKFQQSVLERLEEEAKRQKTKHPPIAPQEGLEEAGSVPMENIEDIVETEPVDPSAPVGEADISAYLRPTVQRVAKNKTFYLDADVIEAIKRTSKAQKVTDSKLVCDILRQVLKV